MDGQTNEGTNARTNEQTDGRSDFIMPQILFGGLKTIYEYKDIENDYLGKH